MDTGRSAHLMGLRGLDLSTLHRLKGDEVVVGDPFRAQVVLLV